MRSRFFSCAILVPVVALSASPAAAQSASLITDAVTGLPPMYPSYLTIFDNQLYFRASNYPGGTDSELWRSDGVKAERAADVLPGPNGSSPAYLTGFNGVLYFQATGATGASRLYQFDPVTSAAGLAPGSSANASVPDELTVYNGNLYFRASKFSGPNIGTELWKFDGATQTYTDIYPGAGNSYPQHFIGYNGLLYFNANGPANPGTELYRANGTAVANAANIYPGNGSSPESFCVYNGKLLFSANDGTHGRELWSYDSVSNQAVLAADIVSGGQNSSSNPGGLAVYKSKVYFSATDGIRGYELWSFDGTAAKMVAEINPTPDPGNGDDRMIDSSPAGLTVFNNILYFSANDGTHGRELWSYDGSQARMVMDINPGQYGSEVSELIVFRDSLYFSADDGYDPGLRSLQTKVYAMVVPEPGLIALVLPAALLLRRRRQ
ncbi:MAG: hypothetical protein NTU53_18445 [Planctomycetota bacterium]|nr:hypothetical protein [Planctomycetota bacterium]